MGVITADPVALTAEDLASMTPERIVKMGRELLAQLGDDPEYVHGNIWPGNISFDTEGKAVLGEGSQAPVSERSPEQIEYMAPEAFWQNGGSHAADLYSIALLMYTAYNHGCLPFLDKIAAEDQERAQALRRRMKGEAVPALTEAGEEVAAVIARALCFAPEQRYSRSGDMLTELSETDEALPSLPPEESDGEFAPEDSEAAAAAAAVGLAGVSAVAEGTQAREQVRPEEAAAGVSANSILMEQELRDMDRESFAPEEKEPPLTAVFSERTPAAKSAAGAGKPTGQKSGKNPKAAQKGNPAGAKTAPKKIPEKKQPEADIHAEALVAQKLKEETAKKAKTAGQKTEKKIPENPGSKKESTKKATPVGQNKAPAKKKKKVGGTIIAIAAGLLVIAALVGVAVYSMGTFEEQTEEHISATVIPEPTAESAVEPTAEPTAEPTPTPSLYHPEAIACDCDWSEIDDLAVIASQEELEAAIAAAEEAGLENLWLGARWLSAENSDTGKDGWFWLDGSELPDNSSFWADGQPPAGDGGRLMLRHNAGTSGWKFYSVTEEAFRDGGSGAYPDLGYIAVRSGMTVRVTASPTPTATQTPVPDSAAYSYSYYYIPISGGQTTTVPAAAPTAAPTAVPEPTAAPLVYSAAASNADWSDLSNLAMVKNKFSDAVSFLQNYNQSHSSDPLYNVWVGASYLPASEAPDGVAGWYWSDGSAVDGTNWAEGEPSGSDGCKLMLRCVGGSWKYYAMADNAAAGLENSGYLSENSTNG